MSSVSAARREAQEKDRALLQKCINKAAEPLGYEPGARCCATLGATKLLWCGLFIAGCVAAANGGSGQTIGLIAIVGGGGMLVLDLSLGKLKQRRFTVIVTAVESSVLIILGIASAAGGLTGGHAGLGIVVTMVVMIPIGLVAAKLRQRDIQKAYGKMSEKLEKLQGVVGGVLKEAAAQKAAEQTKPRSQNERKRKD